LIYYSNVASCEVFRTIEWFDCEAAISVVDRLRLDTTCRRLIGDDVDADIVAYDALLKEGRPDPTDRVERGEIELFDDAAYAAHGFVDHAAMPCGKVANRHRVVRDQGIGDQESACADVRRLIRL